MILPFKHLGHFIGNPLPGSKPLPTSLTFPPSSYRVISIMAGLYYSTGLYCFGPTVEATMRTLHLKNSLCFSDNSLCCAKIDLNGPLIYLLQITLILHLGQFITISQKVTLLIFRVLPHFSFGHWSQSRGFILCPIYYHMPIRDLI